MNLAEGLALFDEAWSPRIVAERNNYKVQVVKVRGEFVWHRHDDTEQLFLVLSGRLEIQLRDRTLFLAPGELFVVARGEEHRPRSDKGAEILLIEPAGTVNTGDAGDPLTAPERRIRACVAACVWCVEVRAPRGSRRPGRELRMRAGLASMQRGGGRTEVDEANGKRLIVRVDDFGMCHAVNEGIAEAFERGIATQTSLMAPCPWLTEATALARRMSLPVGLHMTLTCEWDFLRWTPLTAGPSLRSADGTFYRTVEDARRHSERDEAVAELLAQAQRVASEGLELGYLDVHMGDVAHDACAIVAERLGLPLVPQGFERSFPLTSLDGLSDRDGAGKKAWLLDYLARLTPGTHLLVCHPAVAGPELSSITGPDSIPYRWAEEYRRSDLAVLTDPEVREAVERLGIELTSVAALSARQAGAVRPWAGSAADGA